MGRTILLFLVLIFSGELLGCGGSWFISDIVYYRGKRYENYQRILKAYLSSEDFYAFKHQARWMIQDDRLYLMGFYLLSQEKLYMKDDLHLQREDLYLVKRYAESFVKASLYDLFGGTPGEILPGDWFSGELALETDRYRIYLTIKDGVVIKCVKKYYLNESDLR